MPKSTINLTEVIDMYNNQNESVHSIAEKLGTYPVKIFRMLKKAGQPLRDKSTAQVVSLQSGRHVHPTEGKERTEKEKLKISESRYKSWSKTDKKKHSENCKKRWEEMGPLAQREFSRKGNKAIREASKHGSKLELFLYEALINAGIQTKLHVENLIPNEAMHVDLYLPEKKIIIEIDGPTHYLPIWGEKNLRRHQNADFSKNGLVLAYGYHMIRVKNLCKSLSEAKKRHAIKNLLEVVNSISIGERAKLLELEVK